MAVAVRSPMASLSHWLTEARTFTRASPDDHALDFRWSIHGANIHPRQFEWLAVRFGTVDELRSEYATNISAGGLFIRTDDPLAMDAVVAIALELPGGGPVEGKAVVVHRVTPKEAARRMVDPGIGVAVRARRRSVPRPDRSVPGYVVGERDGRLIDLDGDGRADAIVLLLGGHWCGSGGCNMLVFRATKAGFTLVSGSTITSEPIRVSLEKSHG